MGNRRDRRSRRAAVDPAAGVRALRLEQLFREELNSLLDGELGDERFDGVRITFVELSRDGSRARIWYRMNHSSSRARALSTHAALLHASPYFRTRLCDALPLKRSPQLSFRHDPSVAEEGDYHP